MTVKYNLVPSGHVTTVFVVFALQNYLVKAATVTPLLKLKSVHEKISCRSFDFFSETFLNSCEGKSSLGTNFLNSKSFAVGDIDITTKSLRDQIEELTYKMAAATGKQLATVAGGCFWCIEAVFNMHKGVEKALSGYMGGPKPNPTYEQVCSGSTGHAEVVQLTFDPAVVSYADILEVFWKVHDPTTLNRQGNDVGTQYRSAIFYHSEDQKRMAELSKQAAEEAKLYSGNFVTEISPATTFYPAEPYHQDYYKNNPSQGYCRAVVGPKVKKFQTLFREKLKEDAQKVGDGSCSIM